MLEADIRYLKGIGEKRAALFHKLGVYTQQDLLTFFPRDYEDRTAFFSIKDLALGQTACIKAVLATDVSTVNIRKGMTITKLRAFDESGTIQIVFFNQMHAAL